MTYITRKVRLSNGQVASLRAAVKAHRAVKLRLSAEQVWSEGNIPLMLTETQVKHLTKAKASGKGTEISLSKSQVEIMQRQGGILPFLPLIAAAASAAAPALAAAGKAAALGAAAAAGGAAIKGIADKIKGGRLNLGPPTSGGFLPLIAAAASKGPGTRGLLPLLAASKGSGAIGLLPPLAAAAMRGLGAGAIKGGRLHLRPPARGGRLKKRSYH